MSSFQGWMYVLGTTAAAVLGYFVGTSDLGIGALLLVLVLANGPGLIWPGLLSRDSPTAQAQQTGRDVLLALSDDQLAGIMATVKAGHKIQAIKELRAVNHDGLREAKNAVELLEARGVHWKNGTVS